MFSFVFALGIFFIGLELNKYSLNKMAENKIKILLNKFTSNIYISILLGIILTAFIQSSSAMTIIVINLLETSLLKFDRALAIVIGANIGTTITAHIISIPIIKYYPILFVIGLLLLMFSIYIKKYKYFALTIIAFSAIFGGLCLISDSLTKDFLGDFLLNILNNNNYTSLLTVIIAAIITALIQSSSVFTGIVIKLAGKNLILFETSVLFIIGSNLGTCITAFLASLNSSLKSKYLALTHLIFNIYGVLLILPFKNYFFMILKKTSPYLERQIANGHSIFNFITLIFFLPLFFIFRELYLKECRF